MGRGFKVSLVAAALILAAVMLGMFMAYLFRQGLDKASLWATYLGLPVTVITAGAGVWATVVAAKSLREAKNAENGPEVGPGGVRSTTTESGTTRQTNTSGITIAQIGNGDIHVTGHPLGEPRMKANDD
jgi:hypothetical protein